MISGSALLSSTWAWLAKEKFATETDVYGIKVRYLCLYYKIKANTNFKVAVFRMVIFRPFISEVVVAKVKSSDEDGIRCSCMTTSGLLSLLTFQ